MALVRNGGVEVQRRRWVRHIPVGLFFDLGLRHGVSPEF